MGVRWNEDLRLFYLAAVAALALPGALLLWVTAPPAEAQARCGARDAIARDLARGYGEAQAGSGLAEGRIFELWVSHETGTWTLLITTPGGMSCLAAAGEGWVSLPAPVPGEDM